jgi:uncharacterized glyoxalase superfamily metalloenzyme YdcJ
MAGQPPLTPTEKVRMQAERDSRAKATKEAEEAARQASLKADAEELIRRKSAKDKRAMDTIMQHREYFKQYPDRAAHAIRNAGAYAKYPDLASFTNRPEMWEIPHSQHMAKVRGYTNYQNYKTSLFNTPEEFYKSGWWR